MLRTRSLLCNCDHGAPATIPNLPGVKLLKCSPCRPEILPGLDFDYTREQQMGWCIKMTSLHTIPKPEIQAKQWEMSNRNHYIQSAVWTPTCNEMQHIVYIVGHRCGAVEVERSPRMRVIWVRSPVGTNISC